MWCTQIISHPLCPQIKLMFGLYGNLHWKIIYQSICIVAINTTYNMSESNTKALLWIRMILSLKNKTYRWTWKTLQTSKTSVSLLPSFSTFTIVSFVSMRSLGPLYGKKETGIGRHIYQYNFHLKLH